MNKKDFDEKENMKKEGLNNPILNLILSSITEDLAKEIENMPNDIAVFDYEEECCKLNEYEDDYKDKLVSLFENFKNEDFDIIKISSSDCKNGNKDILKIWSKLKELFRTEDNNDGDEFCDFEEDSKEEEFSEEKLDECFFPKRDIKVLKPLKCSEEYIGETFNLADGLNILLKDNKNALLSKTKDYAIVKKLNKDLINYDFFIYPSMKLLKINSDILEDEFSIIENIHAFPISVLNAINKLVLGEVDFLFSREDDSYEVNIYDLKPFIELSLKDMTKYSWFYV